MEEEDTRGYNKPCPQCSEINWGISDEGRFYCKSCHTIIEKTKDNEVSEMIIGRVQSISRGLRTKKKHEKGWEWYICEGFQFILLKQAQALQTLGVAHQIKDEVICTFWRRFLQKTNQAYVKKPHYRSNSSIVSESQTSHSEGDSELEAFSFSEEEHTDTSAGLPTSGNSTSAAESAVSHLSGSVDGSSYMKRSRRGTVKMSMPMTLAFCYLALLWLRESITLSDLLRFVFEQHIPYLNIEQHFPEEIKIYGPDIKIFKVQTFPEYNDILKKSYELGIFLDLPRFPPITENCFFHPNVLCMKYLLEVNLPDELHYWTCHITKLGGFDDVHYLTLDPARRRTKHICYDVQAAAIIIVVLKIIFALDDETEWQLSKTSEIKNQRKEEKMLFDFREWYTTIRPCYEQAQQMLEGELARFLWRGEKKLYYSHTIKQQLQKKKQMSDNLRRQFTKLTGATADTGKKSPSSFLFNWEEQNTDRICFHGHSLEAFMQKGKKTLSAANANYWLSSLKKCRAKGVLYGRNTLKGLYYRISQSVRILLKCGNSAKQWSILSNCK
ncbi:hypothetical protein GDO86_010417 [Hymenochirus boettgeri]|uniref:TATA box-binding protein-associated factor RNA polymerase I subunit B n=1 Tax=Hymenochirus boettgeri TaxID=247094 RepID=A0A8T2JPE4_9PIPI|nr:hypothetical protein GDO86_010417 [Hymenochirus boettgeri]KAG8445628.1 hypothetical protein GDO86_010417 [Hymenochirus boettgeri]